MVRSRLPPAPRAKRLREIEAALRLAYRPEGVTPDLQKQLEQLENRPENGRADGKSN